MSSNNPPPAATRLRHSFAVRLVDQAGPERLPDDPKLPNVLLIDEAVALLLLPVPLTPPKPVLMKFDDDPNEELIGLAEVMVDGPLLVCVESCST